MKQLSRRIALPAIALAALCAAAPVAAKQKVTVPVDVGVGPTFNHFTGAIGDETPFHYGLKLNLEAIIDQATIRKHKNRIPKRYRRYASGVKEARITPNILIPDSLFISPRSDGTSIYGITWRPLGLNVISIGPQRFCLKAGAGLLLTYAYLDTSPAIAAEATHFLRPGVDLDAHLEVGLARWLWLSLGWASQLYLPQKLGGTLTELGSSDEDRLWHIGQAYGMIHVRFPFTASI